MNSCCSSRPPDTRVGATGVIGFSRFAGRVLVVIA
jgi:hypothetical protein